MSRSYCSYDADWKRRKSVLIRSLFHDIPILSPVEEESNDSSQQNYGPTQEVFPSPPGPCSPLPPLIIEKVSIDNKHDAPEEYYSKLYTKIKIIYKKLFIENRNFSSIDYDSNYSDSSVNDDSDGSKENSDFRFLESNSPSSGNLDSIIEDREARRSSASTQSSGYGADFESMDTAVIDVVNFTTSNEDCIMISGEEESNSENIDGDGIRNKDCDSSRSSDNKESSKGRIDDPELDGEKESYHSIIDDHEMTETKASNEPDDEQSYEKESSDNKNHKIPEETSQTKESDTVRIGDAVFIGGEESHFTSIDDYEQTESDESNETEDEVQPYNTLFDSSFSKESCLVFLTTKTKQDSFEKELKSKEMEETMSEDENELMESNVEPMESDVETSDSSGGPAYRQITTAAMVHFDGCSDAGERESSIKSLILPTRYRRVVASRNVDADNRIDVVTVLDDNADSNTSPSFYTDESDTTEEDFEKVATPQLKAKEERRTPQVDTPEEDDEEMRLHAPGEEDEKMTTPQPESVDKHVERMGSPQPTARDEEARATEEDVREMGSPHPIEQIRTPRPGISHGTIPNTHRSHSESTSEHTVIPQELTALTSSSQNGADQNISEIQTSNDMNEILTSIFNESRNKDGTPISGRKRKYVDKSVQAGQTIRVTWDEMRANFFIGTPKIFRLCACADHICY